VYGLLVCVNRKCKVIKFNVSTDAYLQVIRYSLKEGKISALQMFGYGMLLLMLLIPVTPLKLTKI
jgi:hypothetical protein